MNTNQAPTEGDGEVKIKQDPSKKSGKDKIGEYVDFEEVDDNN